MASPELNLNTDDDLDDVDCKEVTTEVFKKKLKKYSNDAFSVINFNIRSCRKNFPLFLAFLGQLVYSFSLIVLTETWLIKDIDLGFDLKNYKQLNLYRSSHGGGIKALYRDDFKTELLENFTYINNVMEVLTFWLIKGNIKLLICCIYKPPNTNPNLFNEILHEFLSNLPRSAEIILLGDLNVNLYNPMSLPYINLFISNMLSLNFHPVIKHASKLNLDNNITHFSLIDHIWCNFYSGSNHQSYVIHYPLTDHFPVSYLFNRNIVSTPIIKKFRLMNDERNGQFIAMVNNTDFTNIFSVNNPSDAFDKFYKIIMKIFNTCFPVKTKIIRHNKIKVPWMTKKLKMCIRKKFKLYCLMRRGLITRHSFRTYKKTLNWVSKKIRTQYYFKKFHLCKSNIKKTWSNINEVMQRVKNNSILKIVDTEGQEYSGNQLPNLFNNYFTNVVQTLISNLPQGINYDYFNRIPVNRDSCFFYPASDSECSNIIKIMGNKGNVMNDISFKYIKLIADKVVPVITHIYNLCLEQGIYPHSMKIARVIPLFKSGSRQSLNNYRPISTLICFNKIFERLTFNRMSNFINYYRLLSNYQFGFRANYSTGFAVFSLLSDYFMTFNKKLYTVALYLDLSKAFDSVNRDILLHKLNCFGFRGLTNDFIKSYLSNRKQFTDINGVKSSIGDINLGVPQGSVLGPLLFNVYINDLTNIDSECKKLLFADDGVFYVTDSCFEGCIDKLIVMISKISEWLNFNKLVANTGKTKIMLISTLPVVDLPEIYFNGSVIEWITNFKYLGVNIDNKLTFSVHASYVCRNLSRLQGIMYSLSKFLPKQVLMLIFRTLVVPAITYNIYIWGNTFDVHLNPIKVKLNNILRIISNVRYYNGIPDIPLSRMYVDLNILKFNDLYKLYLLKFLHKILYGNNDYYAKYFSHLLPTHSYNTRNTRINLPSVRLVVERNFTIFQLCKLINEIPSEWLEPQSLFTLSRKFTISAISQY